MNPCEKHYCSDCCDYLDIPLMQEDIDRIKSIEHTPEVFYKQNGGLPKLLRVDGRCIFRARGGGCDIYRNHPMWCKLYPMILEPLSGELRIDPRCTHCDEFRVSEDFRVAAREFLQWLNTEMENGNGAGPAEEVSSASQDESSQCVAAMSIIGSPVNGVAAAGSDPRMVAMGMVAGGGVRAEAGGGVRTGAVPVGAGGGVRTVAGGGVRTEAGGGVRTEMGGGVRTEMGGDVRTEAGGGVRTGVGGGVRTVTPGGENSADDRPLGEKLADAAILERSGEELTVGDPGLLDGAGPGVDEGPRPVHKPPKNPADQIEWRFPWR